MQHKLDFFFSSRRRHTRCLSDWSSDVCSSDLKSRCRLVTTMTNRSSHMPTFTMTAMAKSTIGLVRTRLNQSACGTTMLQKMSAQYVGAYGPNIQIGRASCRERE